VLNARIGADLAVHSNLAIVRNRGVQGDSDIRIEVPVEAVEHVIAFGAQQLRIIHYRVQVTRQDVLRDCSVSTWIDNSCIVGSLIDLIRHDPIIDDLTRLDLVDEVILQLLVVIVVREVVQHMPAANRYLCIQ
jgi:hypothetical protein